MIDADRLNAIEDCIANVLQKTRRAQDARMMVDRRREAAVSDPGCGFGDARSAYHHAETMLFAALEELDDETRKLTKHRQRA